MSTFYLPGDQKLSYGQVKQLWLSNGGNPSLADTMAGIGMAESGGHTGVVNDNPATGDYSVGVWQVNYFGNLLLGRTQRYGAPTQLAADPNAQAHAAIDLAGDGSGLHNWSTYTSGAYKAHLAGGSSGLGGLAEAGYLGALSGIPGMGWLTSGGLPNPLKGVDAIAASMSSIVRAMAAASAWVANRHNWVRIAEIGGGLVAVFLGLKMLAGTGAGPVATLAGYPVKGVQTATKTATLAAAA